MTTIRFLNDDEEDKIRETLRMMNAAFYPVEADRHDEANMYTQHLRARYENSAKIIAAIDNEEIVAGCLIRHFYDAFCSKPGLELSNFAVKAERRKQGIASSMLKFIDQYANENKLAWSRLTVRESAEDLASFYGKRGFKNLRITLYRENE